MPAYCAQKLSSNHKPALEAAGSSPTAHLPSPGWIPQVKTSRQNKAGAIKVACFPRARSCNQIKLREKGLPHTCKTPSRRLSHCLLVTQLKSKITRRRGRQEWSAQRKVLNREVCDAFKVNLGNYRRLQSLLADKASLWLQVERTGFPPPLINFLAFNKHLQSIN